MEEPISESHFVFACSAIYISPFSFQIQLQGVASYFDATGHLATDNWGPELKTQDADSAVHKTKFDFLMPNTNYTARVCAVTRRKECGEVRISKVPRHNWFPFIESSSHRRVCPIEWCAITIKV